MTMTDPEKTPEPELFLWKFLFSNGGAFAIAETEEQARAILLAYADEKKIDTTWLPTATVMKVPLDKPTWASWIIWG